MSAPQSDAPLSGVEEISDETTTQYGQGVQSFRVPAGEGVVEGNWMRLVADSGRMWVHAKAYAEGGENTLHHHLAEDHFFFVVSGAAEFTLEDDVTVQVGPFEGILLPRGASYKFRAEPGETLWMVRAGSGDPDKKRLIGMPDGREDVDPERQAQWKDQFDNLGSGGEQPA
jgi:mannose-6-phosphate isomerase-like protein (cupin superfamily)